MWQVKVLEQSVSDDPIWGCVTKCGKGVGYEIVKDLAAVRGLWMHNS